MLVHSEEVIVYLEVIDKAVKSMMNSCDRSNLSSSRIRQWDANFSLLNLCIEGLRERCSDESPSESDDSNEVIRLVGEIQSMPELEQWRVIYALSTMAMSRVPAIHDHNVVLRLRKQLPIMFREIDRYLLKIRLVSETNPQEAESARQLVESLPTSSDKEIREIVRSVVSLGVTREDVESVFKTEVSSLKGHST